MELIDELELRKLLQKKLKPEDLLPRVFKALTKPSISWEEKRSMWHFLYNFGADRALVEEMANTLGRRERVPLDLYIGLCSKANLPPGSSVTESLMKGLKKLKAHDEIICATGWDKWEPRLVQTRVELVAKKVSESKNFRQNLIEKFEFLKNQRMGKQAERVLDRLKQLFPEDGEIEILHAEFKEQWARNVLSSHLSSLQNEVIDRTETHHSPADDEMLRSFMIEGEKMAFEKREFALDLAVAFWFMEDYQRSLDILAWAPASPTTDWMRAEVLYASRHFLEALEQLNILEIKYISDPETTFAVAYLRAKCLFKLGQQSSAIDIMQSIVRVRAHYRSAHALILEWSEGVSWE